MNELWRDAIVNLRPMVMNRSFRDDGTRAGFEACFLRNRESSPGAAVCHYVRAAITFELA